MSNYLNTSYTSLNNLVDIYGDSGSIDTLVCRNLTSSNDIILSKSNTYLSNDTSNNFVIKNQYPVYGPDPLVIDSKLLYFYTFETIDLLGSYMKNQATGNYDMLIDSGVVIDGTLNIPSTSDTIGASILNSSYTLNSSGFTIGLWFQPVLPFNSFSRIASLHSTTALNNDNVFMDVFVNNKLQLTINNGGTATSIAYATNLVSNTLYFLCWVITPTSWTLFVNGTKTVYTTGITFPTNLIKYNTYLGKYSTNTNNITGFIDNFYIYNDVLSDSQITDIYSKNQSPTPYTYYYTIPIQNYVYGTLTGYDYTNLLNLDGSGNMINITTTSLQSQINNLITGKVSSITIGNTTTINAGNDARVENVGTSTDLILNLYIPKGYNGNDGSNGSKGDKGDTGPKGDTGNSVGIETIIGIIESIITQAEITAIQAQILALQGQISIIDGQILELQAKTIFQSVIGTATRFTSNLIINNGISDRINLNQDGTIQTYGKITAVNDDIQCNRLIANDINTNSSNTTIHGSTINIGDSSFINTINVGGGLLSTINLNGIINSYGSFGFSNVNGFLNQFG